MAVISSLKRAAAWGLLHSGALALHRGRFESRRAILLQYHRVNDEADPFFPSLPLRCFRGQVDYLAREYRVDALESILDWLEEGAPGPPRVAVTVDDGYPDTYECVLPELAKRGIPATLFLCTSPPETGQPLWVDRTRNLIKHARASVLALPELGLDRLSLDTWRERLGVTRLVVARMKHLRPAEIHETLGRLEGRLEPEGPPLRVLSWNQVRRLAAGPFRLGSHTHRHYMLSRLDDGEIASEVETSLSLIRERVGVRVETFAYPNGKPGDYDGRAVGVLRRLGIRCALSSRHGVARPGQDFYDLQRFYTTEPSLSLFAARIAGLGHEDAGPGAARH